MTEKTRKLLKELVSRPPERLAAVMERLDACEDLSQWERLHVDFSRELGREMLERRLEEADEPPGECPHCRDAADETPWGASFSGVSPP